MNNGWIPLEAVMSHSSYTFNDAVRILKNQDSKYFECDWYEPICVKLKQNIRSEGEWTEKGPILLVRAFPIDTKYKEIEAFFTRYFPVEKIKMLEIFNSFNGSVMVKFVHDQDMFTFLNESQENPIYFTQYCRFGVRKEHRLNCRLVSSGGQQLISNSSNASHSGLRGKLHGFFSH